MIELFIKNPIDGTIWEIPYRSIRLIEEVNLGRTLDATVDYHALKAVSDINQIDPFFVIAGSWREMYMKKNGQMMYLGMVSNLGATKQSSGSINLSIPSSDYVVMLKNRRTGRKRFFDNQDSAQIAWTLINESQQSNDYADWGITAGSLPTCKSRQRTYVFDELNDALLKMSNINVKDGFDFEIDFNKNFNVFNPLKGSVRKDIIFDERNINGYSYSLPLTRAIKNQVHVVGDGYNDDFIYTTRTSPDEHLEAFTLLEDVLTERDVKILDTLNDKGDKFLEYSQVARGELTIETIDGEPDILDYNIGDYVRIQILELGINNEYKRVIRRSTGYDSNGFGTIKMDLI